MIKKTIGYSYNDLTIVPAEISMVESRTECNVFDDNDKLPIFCSPMAGLNNLENYDLYEKNHLQPILPRNICNLKNETVLREVMEQSKWVALGLNDFKKIFIDDVHKLTKGNTYNVCVDIANGHMEKLYNLIYKAKMLSLENDYTLVIMTGNIANPKTYEHICKNNSIQYGLKSYKIISYIRCGIGTGSYCITSSNTGIHYPIATLIDECKQIKTLWCNDAPAIVADGGIRNYSDVTKALALGADYVMIGGLFISFVESAAKKMKPTTYCNKGIKIDAHIENYRDFYVDSNGLVYGYFTQELIDELIRPWKENIENNPDDLIYKDKYEERLKSLSERKCLGNLTAISFGMASGDAQKLLNGEKTKTAEGITKETPVKYAISGWVENMIAYLKSAMSYTGYTSLNNFIGGVELIPNSPLVISSVNK